MSAVRRSDLVAALLAAVVAMVASAAVAVGAIEGGPASVAFLLVAVAAMRLIRDREDFKSDKAQCSYGKKPQ